MYNLVDLINDGQVVWGHQSVPLTFNCKKGAHWDNKMVSTIEGRKRDKWSTFKNANFLLFGIDYVIENGIFGGHLLACETHKLI